MGIFLGSFFSQWRCDIYLYTPEYIYIFFSSKWPTIVFLSNPVRPTAAVSVLAINLCRCACFWVFLRRPLRQRSCSCVSYSCGVVSFRVSCVFHVQGVAVSCSESRWFRRRRIYGIYEPGPGGPPAAPPADGQDPGHNPPHRHHRCSEGTICTNPKP